MKKRAISIFFVFFICINTFSMDILGANDEENYAGNQLRVLGILKGYEDGTLRLDNNIVRSEVATLIVRILGYEKNDVVGSGKNFSDVPTSYWGYTNIQKAFKLKLVNGYPDNSFKPKDNISYAEVIAIMVNSLGENNDLKGTWPNNYIDKAKELGVIPENSNVAPNKKVTRGEMSVIIWDTLLVKTN